MNLYILIAFLLVDGEPTVIELDSSHYLTECEEQKTFWKPIITDKARIHCVLETEG